MRLVRILTLTIAALGVALSAAAEPITFLVHGRVDRFLVGGMSSVPIGSAFEMTLTWDSDTSATQVDADSASYFNAVLAATVSPGGLNFVLSPTSWSLLGVANGTGSDYDRLFGIVSQDSEGTSWHARWDILFPSNSWDSTALPTDIAAALNSGYAKLFWNTQGSQDVGLEATITGIYSVPEPSTLLSLGIAAAGFRFRPRRRAAARA